jgi:actin-related protein 5
MVFLPLLCADINNTSNDTAETGSSGTRAGWSFEDTPRFNITPIFSKYRDRKLGKTYSFVGNDVLADTTARGHMRNAFEAGSGIVSNWDVMESLFDYVFIKMGVEGSNGGVDVPIVMTEAVANLPYSRKCKCPPFQDANLTNLKLQL